MIIVFHGKDAFLSLRDARDKYKKLREENPDFEAFEIDAESADPDEILSTYQTQQMFGSGKIIFYKRIYSRKDKSTVTESLMEQISTTEEIDTEVIIWEEKKIPANTKYYKFLKKEFSINEYPELNKRTFITWAKKESESKEIEASRESLTELAERSNYDPERFLNELSKLKILGLTTLDSETIKKISTDTYEYDIWNLIDSINSGDTKDTTKILNNLLEQKVDAHYILAMIFRNTRMLTLTKVLSEKNSDNREIASTLKIPPFTVPSLVKSANRTNIHELTQLYEKLTNLDYQIKRGEIEANMGLTLLSTIL